MSARLLTSFVVLLLALSRPTRAAEDPTEFFEKKIRPVLIAECYDCHSSTAKKLKGNLKLDTRQSTLTPGDSGKPPIVPGDPDHSLLLEAIRQANPDLTMPPKKQLPASVINDFETWIRLGAPDPRTDTPTSTPKPDPKKHWAFQPVRDPALPTVSDPTWIRTPIDAFVLADLDKRHVKPNPTADRRTLIRRAYYDLTGLPPTYEEVQAFESDPSPDAYAKLIDRLLASPRYGERYGRHWLDLARYADTKGYVYSDREDPRFVHSHNYRDWVIAALSKDLPYDQFLKLQIAADQLVPPPSPKAATDSASRTAPSAVGEGRGEGRTTSDSPHSEPGTRNSELSQSDLAAMGFLTLGRRFLGVIPDIIDDRIDTLTRTTQGLSVGCARCHDHKFDPISTKDYYSLYGVFDASAEHIVPLQPPPANKTPEYLAYEAELKTRTDKLAETFAKRKEQAADRARAKCADYLVALLTVDKIPDELFYEFRDASSIYPAIVRQWQQYLFAKDARNPRIWQPWFDLTRLPANDFATKPAEILTLLRDRTNPHVAAALSAAPLTSPRDVATAYGKLLQDADHRWKQLLKSDPKAAALPDPDWEELRQVLYEQNSPTRVPAGSIVEVEFYFDEGVRVELAKLQKNIEAWNIESPGATPQAVILEDRPPQPNPRVFRRGNPATKGEEVPRQYLQILSGPTRQPFAHGSGRLELANAIANPQNPLTARVMANRLWQWHFGSGLVKTPSDFGLRCDPPTNPALLDHLATKFIQSGWSMKSVHRMIMLSNTYQQGPSSPSPGTPGEGRGEGLPPNTSASASQFSTQDSPLRRLDFESLRDSLLLASGDLDLTPGGRPAPDLLTSTRRTVYTRVDRQFLPGVLRTFDFANPDLHTPERPETTVPQQALFMMNSPFVQDRARHLAAGSKGSITDEQRITKLYEITLQRRPTEAELRAALTYLSTASSDPKPDPPKPVSPLWQYGYAQYNPTTAQLTDFKKLPHYTGTAWQGGSNWPDAKLGWVQLTSEGGHAGNDLQHAAVRRWISPLDGVVSISGPISHTHPEGHGITAIIHSSRQGQLATIRLHNRKATLTLDSIDVKKGDTIDFAVTINQSLNNNDFLWSPTIQLTTDKKQSWSAKKDFAGRPSPPSQPLTPWEKLAQVLLMSDEFVFVD